MKFTYKSLLSFGLFFIIFNANAQYDPNDMSYGSPASTLRLREQQERHEEDASRANAEAAQREAQRQWQIRENKVLREIAELKRTPFYGALLYSFSTKNIGWGGIDQKK